MTQGIYGIQIPSIINNHNYFYNSLSIYSNGLVDCWELVDLDFLKQKIQEKWIVCSIPDGEDISIHHLGNWKIRESIWEFNEETYYDYILKMIKHLNPKMENLHNYHGSLTEENNYVTTNFIQTSESFPIKRDNQNSFFSSEIKGEILSAFYKHTEKYYLVDICIYSDETIQIRNLPIQINIKYDEFEKLIENKYIITQPLDKTRIIIHNLGSFILEQQNYSTSIEDFLLEAQDIVATLNNKSNSLAICRSIYMEYMEEPSTKLRSKLKESYEKIPSHMRHYVVDMDVKDIPIRMIVYGDQELKNWSHYKAAKKLGLSLPSIKIPKPKDE